MQDLMLLLKQDQITGFSYSFSKALLDRLNILFIADGYYEKDGNGVPKELTKVAHVICHYLDEQMPNFDWLNGLTDTFWEVPKDEDRWESQGKEKFAANKETFAKLIAQGYDFLSTFHEGKNTDIETVSTEPKYSTSYNGGSELPGNLVFVNWGEPIIEGINLLKVTFDIRLSKPVLQKDAHYFFSFKRGTYFRKKVLEKKIWGWVTDNQRQFRMTASNRFFFAETKLSFLDGTNPGDQTKNEIKNIKAECILEIEPID